MLDAFLRGDLADVDHAFDALRNLNEGAELSEAGDLTLDHRTRRKLLRGLRERIGQQLLEPQRDPALFELHAEHDNLHALSLFENIAWLPDLLRPRHLR